MSTIDPSVYEDFAKEVYGITQSEIDSLKPLHGNGAELIATLVIHVMRTAPSGRSFLSLSVDGKPSESWSKYLRIILSLSNKMRADFRERHSRESFTGMLLLAAIGKVVVPLLQTRERQRMKGNRRLPIDARIGRQVHIAFLVKEALARNGGKKTKAYAEVAALLGISVGSVRDAWGAKDRGRQLAT